MTQPLSTIDTITAWIITEVDGSEGLAGFQTTDGWMPMIGANSQRIEGLRPMALQLAAALSLPVRLVRFSTREVLEEHLPEPL